MSNMSYCRFRNTVGDLSDCADNIYDVLSEDEARARKQLIKLCFQIIQDFITDDLELDENAVNDLPKDE